MLGEDFEYLKEGGSGYFEVESGLGDCVQYRHLTTVSKYPESLSNYKLHSNPLQITTAPL